MQKGAVFRDSDAAEYLERLVSVEGDELVEREVNKRRASAMPATGPGFAFFCDKY